MKSRYDVLSARSERRNLAVFRSSAAVGIALLVLAIAALAPAGSAPSSSATSDTFGLEIGATRQDAAAAAGESAPAPTSGRAAAPTAIATADEFAFPAGHELEPLSY